MLEKVEEVQNQIGVLVNWVSEMKALTQNPYSNGLNIPKVLNDLGNFATELNSSFASLREMLPIEEEPKKEESASAEQ